MVEERGIAPVEPPAAVSSFAANVLANDSMRRNSEKSSYRSTLHVSATSNVCERLFSAARLIMNHLRCNMDPTSCELLLFLKFNRRFWLNATFVNEVLADMRPAGDEDVF